MSAAAAAPIKRLWRMWMGTLGAFLSGSIVARRAYRGLELQLDDRPLGHLTRIHQLTLTAPLRINVIAFKSTAWLLENVGAGLIAVALPRLEDVAIGAFMRQMTRYLAVLALLGSASSPALAWGQNGHRITGTIAEQHLSGIAHARIRMILGDESLAEASTWADEMRSNPAEFWQRTANPWHYVTVPKGRIYSQVGAPVEGDGASALQRFSSSLRDPSTSPENKQLALRFIVHIIGDLHQPLHAGNGTDKGGNDVKVTFSGDETNLHSVWDTGLVEGQNLSFSEYAARLSRRIGPQDVVAWWETNPAVWIGESAALRDQLYPQQPRLSWDYTYRHLPTVEIRLQQAGVRIAAYLNQLFAA